MLNLSEKIPRNKVILSAVISAVVILLLVLRNEIFSIGVEEENLEHQIIRAQYLQHQFDDNQTAFVFGATGIYSTSELFKCMSAIESLSTIGGWGGHVYLLLDQTTCLNKDAIKKLPNKNIHIINIKKERRRRLRNEDGTFTYVEEETHEVLPDSLSDVHGYTPLNFTRAELEHMMNTQKHHRQLITDQPFQRAMAVKMHLLEYLPEHIKYAAWYDCDVLFVKPQCVRKMIEHKPVFSENKLFYLRSDYHVGTFVAHADYSKPGLQLWHDKLLEVNSASALGNGEARADNEVFADLFGRWSNDTNSKYGLLHPVWQDAMPYALPYNGSLYWNTTECVIHLSNGRCTHLGSDNIDEVVGNLHLQSYQDQKWCPSVLRRKFKAYGFQWPFCWNPPSYFWNG